MDQHPVVDDHAVEESDVHVAHHTRDVDLRESRAVVDQLDHAAWNGETHQAVSFTTRTCTSLPDEDRAKLTGRPLPARTRPRSREPALPVREPPSRPAR